MTGSSLVSVLGLTLALAAGCEESSDVVGPFTGEVHRFVVDDIRFARSSTEARAIGADLGGDGHPDNQLGLALVFLENQSQNLSPHGADMIRSGAIASTVEVQADDLGADDTVAVRYLGADGAPSVIVGGRLIDGAFRPNRTATTDVPGEATVRLPIFLEADPLEVQLHGLEIELVPDDGGGYLATVRGAIDERDTFAVLHGGITQMVASNPGGHLSLERLFDRNRDGEISLAELQSDSLLLSLLGPDLQLRTFSGRFLSFAFQVHLAPCTEGRCVSVLPSDPCHDRVRDGNETDVDCGGSCPLACAGFLACGLPSDCQSLSCVAGACAVPTCTDGVRDGFESDVDCGGHCDRCALGKRCFADVDCASNHCFKPGPGGTCV